MNIDICNMLRGERPRESQKDAAKAIGNDGTKISNCGSDQALTEDTFANRGSAWERDNCYRLSSGKIWTLR
jgi:hypothetical protein